MISAETVSDAADKPDCRAYHHGHLRQALIAAARALITETQDWTFSLREVARRAGVSHNAPYNHFPDKRDMLAAIAADGFETLRERTLLASGNAASACDALAACAHAYVQNGVENPALYRLMFGSALARSNQWPAEARDAGKRAKTVLDDIIVRGARSGEFAVCPESPEELSGAALSLWSAVHGLTMFVIDGMTDSKRSVPELIDNMVLLQCLGLTPRQKRDGCGN
jgi:AcrR family transcriptional regulator